MAKGDFERRAQEWMRGRNGADDLGRFSSWLGLVLVFVDIFVRSGWLGWLGVAAVAYSWWRMSSRKIESRARENEAFMSRLGPLRPWVVSPKAAFAESRTHKHVACPSCGQRVRVPRGKGLIRVTCPRCHGKFEIKS